MEPQLMQPLDFKEDNSGSNPAEVVMKNAVSKFVTAASHYPGWLLTADTLVSIGGEILGKPSDVVEAAQMLGKLSGRKHQVFTAYVLGRGDERFPKIARSILSEVEFVKLSTRQIEEYIKSGEPMDKAGAYGIQGEGANFIRRVHGSPSNVMGLPMYEVVMDLVRCGVACFACPC
jgi:septum formation protein